MKRKGKLIEEEGGYGLVSPPVDLLFNLMITMFVFLMIYMAAVVPEPSRYLQFTSNFFPQATVWTDYHTSIGVCQGSGNYLFFLHAPENSATLVQGKDGIQPNSGARKLSRPGDLELSIDPTMGSLRGRFFPDCRDGSPGKVYIPVTVVDRKELVRVPPEKAELWGDVHLFFHEEHQVDLSDDPSPSLSPPESLDEKTVECHPAIRGTFNVEVLPDAIPFALARNPLRLSAPTRVLIAEGGPFETSISITGGIEPYEIRLLEAPEWVHLDESRSLLHGQSPDASSGGNQFAVTLEVKDAQTPKGDWEAAKRQEGNRGQPSHRLELGIQIEGALSLLEIELPPYARIGEPVSGSLRALGGIGRLTFSAENLPPGLQLSPHTGKIFGIPETTGDFQLRFTVEDEHPQKQRRLLSRPIHQFKVVPPRPAPAIVGGQR